MIIMPTHSIGPWPDVLFAGFRSMYHNNLIWAFVMIVVLDIGSGFLKALVTKQLNSTIGLEGLTKHFAVVFLTLIIYPYMAATAFSQIADIWVGYYIAIYALSFVENWGQAGLPLPQVVKDYVYKLSSIAIQKGDKK